MKKNTKGKISKRNEHKDRLRYGKKERKSKP